MKSPKRSRSSRSKAQTPTRAAAEREFSSIVVDGPERAASRAMLHAVGFKREDFQSDDPFEREFKGIQKFMPISRSHAGFVQILHAGRNHQFGYIYYIMEMADDEKTGQEINPGTYMAKVTERRKARGPVVATHQPAPGFSD